MVKQQIFLPVKNRQLIGQGSRSIAWWWCQYTEGMGVFCVFCVRVQVYGVPGSKWTTLSHRRLQNWGGTPHPKGMLVEKIPSVSNKQSLLCLYMKSPYLFQWLDQCCGKVAKLGVFEGNPPNHVLINEYTPGQGIMVLLAASWYFDTQRVYNMALGDCGKGSSLRASVRVRVYVIDS